MDGPHEVITIGNNSYPKPWVTTPLVRSTALSRAAGCNVYLKLENVQPSGSFKSRGIGNLLVTRLAQAAESAQNGAGAAKSVTHFYSSSGGNAGLACVQAAATLGCASTVVVPMTTSQYMMGKIKEAGATDVIQVGESWVDANHHLVDVVIPKAEAAGVNAVYVHPFDGPDIWAGHSTMIQEIASHFRGVPHSKDLSNGVPGTVPKIDAVVCSVGGGGLFSGVMQGLDSTGLSDVPVLALETVGADSLSESLRQGKLVTLPRITSIATTLGARTVCEKAFEYGQRSKVKSIVLTDEEAVDACLRFADCERILVEPSCGVAVAMCFEDRLKAVLPNLSKDSCVVVVVCGGSNVSFDHLKAWKSGIL